MCLWRLRPPMLLVGLDSFVGELPSSRSMTSSAGRPATLYQLRRLRATHTGSAFDLPSPSGSTAAAAKMAVMRLRLLLGVRWRPSTARTIRGLLVRRRMRREERDEDDDEGGGEVRRGPWALGAAAEEAGHINTIIVMVN